MPAPARIVSLDSARRVPRIGVARGGHIELDRIVRDDNVTIGRARDNTIVLRGGFLPERFDLVVFDRPTGSHYLRFTEEMTGQFALGVGSPALTLDQLKLQGLAVSQLNGIWAVELTRASRGKITIGEVAVLFQMIAPPPNRTAPEKRRFRPLAALGRLLSRLPF